MVPGATVLALGGAVGMGLGTPVMRHVLKKGDQLFSETEFLLGRFVMTWVWSVLFLAPLWMLFGGQILVDNPAVFWSAVFLWFLANIGVQVSNMYANRYAVPSLTLPYQAMTPGLLTLAVFLIGERPSTWGYAGIAIIAIGTYIHGRLGAAKTLWEWFIPLWRLLFLPSHWKTLDAAAREAVRDEQRGVRFAFTSAFCGTFGLMSEAMMARHGNPAFGFSVGLVLLTLFSAVWYLAMKKVTERAVKNSQAVQVAPFRERIALHGKWMVWGGFLLAIAYFLPMIANRLAPIAYVGTIKRFSIPIGVFASAKWFKEKVRFGRWITTLIITAGAVILVLDDTPAKIIDFVDQILGGSEANGR